MPESIQPRRLALKQPTTQTAGALRASSARGKSHAMLWYILRVGFIMFWHSLLKKRVPGARPFRLRLRAWPWRCDTYMHMNNASYLRLAEDVRWAWTARTGLLGHSLSNRWMFLVGGVDLLYRRPIPLMSSFEVACTIIGADGRWIFFSQEFLLPNKKVAARAIVRATVKSPKGDISPRMLTTAIGAELPPPSPDIEIMNAMSKAQLAAIGDS